MQENVLNITVCTIYICLCSEECTHEIVHNKVGGDGHVKMGRFDSCDHLENEIEIGFENEFEIENEIENQNEIENEKCN